MGVLFVLVCAVGMGTVISYVVGIGSLGRSWHVGIGVAGVALGWMIVNLLRMPYFMRMAIDGWPVYPVWMSVGTMLAALTVALAQPDT